MAKRKASLVGRECCSPKQRIKNRPLLTPEQAADLKGVFKVLASDTRLRLLHALIRRPEMCVGELADALAMKPQAVSNQLQRLSEKRILSSRREGNSIYYRIIDPCIAALLDRGLCLMEELRSCRAT